MTTDVVQVWFPTAMAAPTLCEGLIGLLASDLATQNHMWTSHSHGHTLTELSALTAFLHPPNPQAEPSPTDDPPRSGDSQVTEFP